MTKVLCFVGYDGSKCYAVVTPFGCKPFSEKASAIWVAGQSADYQEAYSGSLSEKVFREKNKVLYSFMVPLSHG